VPALSCPECNAVLLSPEEGMTVWVLCARCGTIFHIGNDHSRSSPQCQHDTALKRVLYRVCFWRGLTLGLLGHLWFQAFNGGPSWWVFATALFAAVAAITVCVLVQRLPQPKATRMFKRRNFWIWLLVAFCGLLLTTISYTVWQWIETGMQSWFAFAFALFLAFGIPLYLVYLVMIFTGVYWMYRVSPTKLLPIGEEKAAGTT